MSYFRSIDEATASSRQARTLQNVLRNYETFNTLKSIIEASNPTAFAPDPVSGWTFLHFAASTDLPTQHWEWILEHCEITPQRTALGESVIDIFFKHRLGNLKWQSSNSRCKAKRLVAVLANCDSDVIQDLPTTPSGLLELPWDETVTAHSNHVRVARTFLRDLYLLLRSLRPKTESSFDWWTELAYVGPSVPSLVAEWMQLYLSHCHICPNIHTLGFLCQSKPLPHLPRQAPSLLTMLISDETANSIIPETGRFPISEALASGWSFEGVYELWKRTKKKQLPLFVHVAMAEIDETSVEILARHKNGAFSVYCWHMASDFVRQEFIEAARSDYELERLTSIFECLRASPTSLKY